MCNTKSEFTKIVNKRRKAAALKKKLEAKVDKLDEEIIEYAKKKGEAGGKNGNTLIVFGDDFKVSVISITQHPWDGDKLRQLLGDDVSKYQGLNIYFRIDIR